MIELYAAMKLYATLVLTVFSLSAQEFRATIQGAVFDPSKAVVGGAEVILRNADTAVERRTESDATGLYVFPLLPPGTYTLTTKKAGFKTDVREGIRVSLGDNTRVDVDLAIGQAAETVSVSATAAAVQTDSSSLGSVVRKEIIDSLPLKGHSSLFMFTLATGVVNSRYGEDTRANDTITNVSYSANGAPMASGDVSVDGVANTVNVNRGVNISQWVPAVDAVGEFKLQTGTLPAEYGRSGGAFMNIMIKSGTNDLHGTFYEFLRNAALDANSFYNNRAGLRLARYGSNTYGATIGGPVLFPKLYNGKNRTFFFFSWEGSREGNGLTNLLNVPTQRMRSGDFSEVAAPIFNPLSGRMVNGVPTRDPLPGQIVPASQQDAVGKNILTYYPVPNITGPNTRSPWLQNFTYSYKWPRDYDTNVVKIDHSFGTKNQMFSRINFGQGKLIFPRSHDGIAAGPAGSAGNRVSRPHWGVAFSDTHMLSPRSTIDIRLGYARGVEDNKPWSDGFDPATLGFASNYKGLIQGLAFPTISVTEMQQLAGSPLIKDPGDTWSLQPSMSSQRGSHLIKFGGEGRLLRGHFFRNLNPAGSFNFGVAQTGGPNPNTPAATSGFALASLLFGFGSGSMSNNTGVSIQNIYYGLYLQDDWKVNRKLTLNLGVRWEYETPRTERYNRATRGFGFGVASPVRAPGLNLTGGLLYANKDGRPRGIYSPDRNNFAPRVGFAYSLTPKTVLRGGYALSYIPVIGSVFSDGFSVDTPWVSSLDGGLTITNRLSNPFPTGLIPAIGSSLGLATLAGQGVSFVEPGDRTPKFHNWHFDVQRELPSQSLVEVAYVGSRGVSLVSSNENLNQVPPSQFGLGAALKQQVPNPFFGVLTAGGLIGATVAREQLLRPYPQFTGVTRSSPAFGNSSYHSVQMKLEKRLAHGVAALISFTASKNLADLNSPRDAYNRSIERAISDIDVPQRLTIAGSWDIPFGRGRKFGTNMHRAADLLAGGWQLSTFQTYQGGFALGFGFVGGNFAAGTSPRVNLVGDPASGTSGSHQSRLDRYFNTDAFTRPADFTLGNLAPRIQNVRSPGMNNNNITATKDFTLTERFKAQFRGSLYNALNHPVFGGPNTTVGNAAYGRISTQANISRQIEFGLRVSY
jgi:hypothetical protein